MNIFDRRLRAFSIDTSLAGGASICTYTTTTNTISD